jgi:hypothetical protein
MNNLTRRYFKEKGANKYHIDCEWLEKNPESIKVSIENSIQNTDDISIIKSVINTFKNQRNRNIVVKIGKVNKTIEKEYQIGKILEKEKNIGFINYICLFTCYDDTYDKIKQNKLTGTKSICKAEKIDDQKRVVLIMPFIADGSIKKFNWSTDNFDVLKSVLQQTIMSICYAYDKCGFIHGDLHLDNILLKKTKKNVIVYGDNIKIKTYGYKIIIMDFDSSFINIEHQSGIEFYWLNLYNVLSRVNSDIGNSKGDKINMNNMNKITTFIDNQRIHKKSHLNTHKLLEIINDSSFSIIETPKFNFVYNPNILF